MFWLSSGLVASAVAAPDGSKGVIFRKDVFAKGVDGYNTKDPRKHNLMKLRLAEIDNQAIVPVCMMQKRSKGFVKSRLHSRL